MGTDQKWRLPVAQSRINVGRRNAPGNGPLRPPVEAAVRNADVRRLQRINAEPSRGLVPIDDPADALRLLGSIWLGRIVFTVDAVPAIRPVDHVVADGCVIVRTDVDTVLARTLRRSGTRGTSVAYEADDIDLVKHIGWSVIVTGRAHLVTDPREIRRYRAVLHSSVESPMDLAVRIRPSTVTGYQLDDAPNPYSDRNPDK